MCTRSNPHLRFLALLAVMVATTAAWESADAAGLGGDSALTTTTLVGVVVAGAGPAPRAAAAAAGGGGCCFMTERATLRARSASPRRLCASSSDCEEELTWRRSRGCWALMRSYTCATSFTARARSSSATAIVVVVHSKQRKSL